MFQKKRVANTLSLFQLMSLYPTKGVRHTLLRKDSVGRRACLRQVRLRGPDNTEQKGHVGRYWCGDCRSYFNALTNTPLEYAKVDIRKWAVRGLPAPDREEGRVQPATVQGA